MKNLMVKGTKCLLIQPKISRFSSLNYIDVCKFVGAKYPIPPLGLMTVAALLPQQWEYKIIDANIEPILDEYFEWTDIICTGGILSQQLEIFSIIEKAHSFGKKVVVGGPEPSSQPQFYNMADFLIIGEGENTIPDFLQDLEKGCQKGVYKSTDMPDMTEAVIPRFDLIKFKDYLMMGIQFSRGCPYNCEFCNIIEIFGRKSRTKTSQQIINELQTLYQLGYRGRIYFVDDNFFGNRKSVKELLTVLGNWSQGKEYPFYFSTEATLNLVDDDELLQMAKDVDFRYLSIGIETSDNDILNQIQKKQNVNRSIPQTIKQIYSYGIAVDASFILGFDGENEQTAANMIRCIQDSGICMAVIGTLYALPNTRFSKRLKKEGRLFTEAVKQKDKITDIDQMTSGLNFATFRPRQEILRDFVKVLKNVYDPVKYYQRLTYTGLNLKRSNKYKPAIARLFKMFSGFLRICLKAGFNRKTGRLYWQTFFTILLKNPRALETVVSFAAIYIHLSKHSQFIIDLTNKKLETIKNNGQEEYDLLNLSNFIISKSDKCSTAK